MWKRKPVEATGSDIEKTPVTHQILKRFLPFAKLGPKHLDLILDLVHVKRGPPGEVLCERGSRDRYSYFLLVGTVDLEAADGRRLSVAAGTDGASVPLSELRPRRYRVQARSAIQYFRIDTAVWQAMAQSDDPLSVVEALPDPDASLSSEDAASLLGNRINSDLQRDRLILPTLPDIALRVSQAVRDERTDSARVSSIIQLDPAITTKVIKVSNSALYGGRTAIKSCKDAVVRLGLDATASLVMSFALREVFQAKTSHIQRRMKTLWEHSVRVAAISYVLAGITRRFNPERALLAGLIHDIGVLPVFSYADAIGELAGNDAQIDELVSLFRARLGSRVLAAWGFPPALVAVAEHAENWGYEGGPDPDYCDLVIVAQLHSFIGGESPEEVPGMDTVPAFHKLFQGGLTPKDSIKLLRRASEKIARIQAPLRAN